MILRGLLLLARGQKSGIVDFRNTMDAFTASLAPLIAFPLVGASLSALGGHWQVALVGFCARLCAVLVLPLLAYEFARLAGRETLWLRTAAALDWSFWMMIPVLFILALISSAMVAMGLPMQMAIYIILGAMGVYLLWYHWVIVRAGLEVSHVQAALFVIVSDFAVGILSLGPALIHFAFYGFAAPI